MNFFESIGTFVRKIDVKSWPAFFMFTVVLVAAGALNYVGMEPTFGAFIAVTVAAFFGIGVLAWHIVESRTDDSEYQEQVAQVAKWITVSLDAVLLIVNFVRIDFVRIEATGASGWDILAYVIISVAAAVHVGGYLLWTENDPRRAIKRSRERDLFVIERKGDEAHSVVATTRKKLEAHKYVVDEEASLRQQYAGVDQSIVDDLVAKMKRDYAAKMDELEAKPTATTAPNGQGKPQERPHQTQRLQPAVQYQKTVKQPDLAESEENPTQPGPN